MYWRRLNEKVRISLKYQCIWEWMNECITPVFIAPLNALSYRSSNSFCGWTLVLCFTHSEAAQGLLLSWEGAHHFPCLVWISSNHICRGCAPTFLLLPPGIKIGLIHSYYWVRKPGEKKASMDIAFKFMWQGQTYVLHSESRDRPGISAKVFFQLNTYFNAIFELCSKTAISRHWSIAVRKWI